MFGIFDRKGGFEADHRHGDYDGDGIWLCCPDCGKPRRLQDAAFDGRLEALCGEVGETSEAQMRAFGMSTGEGRWDVVPEGPMFVFTTPEGRRATASYGVVASWNDTSHSWLWAWAFPETWMPEPALDVARHLKIRGTEETWEAVTTKNLVLGEHEAWHLAKLAARAAHFPMVYRARVNEVNWHYFAIGRMSWES